MNRDRFARMKALLLRAADLSEEDRHSFLDEACRDDPALRAEVLAVLAHDRDSREILRSGSVLRRDPGEPPEAGRLTGRTVSHYRILELLGRGGMGEVYKAEDLRLKRPVALKFLRPDAVGDGDMKARFIREAQAAAALEHASICTIHAIEESDGLLFLAMAYLEGRTLKERIEEGPVPLAEALDIAIELALGLEAAHAKGIVHRDVKSSNVMLCAHGRAQIMDFGLARPSGPTEITKSGAVIGTVAYMSPEQARGDPVDHRTDIWSLGVVLHEMLAGELPFRGAHEQAIMHAILNDAPAPLAQRRPDLLDAVERVVELALAKAPDCRYPDVTSMLADLRSLRRGLAPEIAESTPRARRRPSIAVLPLKNLSGNPEQDYFCDGIAEELINALARVRGIRVAARTSTFTFKGKEMDIREIGQKLAVDSVLEGSVRLAGNRLRITARLVNVADGCNLWSERYDRLFEDIFAIQDEISLAIVEQLGPQLLEGERENLLKRHTNDPEAYRLYMMGTYFTRKHTESGVRRAFDYFERSIERDPEFALGYAGLSEAHMDGAVYGPREKASFDAARDNALRALAIDSTSPQAHYALASVKRLAEWDWAGAEAEYRRTLELNPGDADAHYCYAHLLAILGRADEAVREARVAVDLEPVSVVCHSVMGSILWMTRRYDEAIEQLRRTIEMDPSSWEPYIDLVRAYLAKGMVAEARATLESLAATEVPQPRYIAMHGLVHAACGEGEEVRKSVEELERRSREEYVHPYYVALLHTALGDKDGAFACLERVVDERSRWWPFPPADAALDPLRSDPRWPALMRRMGLA